MSCERFPLHPFVGSLAIITLLCGGLLGCSSDTSRSGRVEDLGSKSTGSTSASGDEDGSGGGWFDPGSAETTTPVVETTPSEQTNTTTPPPATQLMTGTFFLIDTDIAGTWSTCTGTGGYSDFGPGMNVTVRDGQGNIVGVGSTESLSEADRTGTWAESVRIIEEAGTGCAVKFAVDVKPAEFYNIDVGSRGDISYTAADIAAAGWHVVLTLGG